MIQSPIYSFVDFENRLAGISLPAYQAELAFQFYFPSSAHLPRGGADVVISIADINNNILFTLNATVTDACAWGVITGIDASADFPITVGAGQIIAAGVYDTIYDLWDAFQLVGINANSDLFVQCCSENLQDYTLSYTTAASAAKTININFYRGVVYVDNTANNQEADFQSNGISIGSCYKIAVTLGADTSFSNAFKRVDDTKYLAFLSYYNNEDGYEFYYGDGTLINKLWLPFYLRKPSPVITRKIYRRSDKTYKVQFSTIEKELEAITDYFSEEIHDRLVIALEHDNKHVFSNGRYKVDTDIFMNSDYNIGWQSNDIYNAPIAAQATFKVLEFFAGRNSNCEKRPVCIPLPTQGGGGGGGCIAVAVTPTTLPDADTGELYGYDIILTGDGPFVLSAIVKPSWITITLLGDTVQIRGTAPGTEETGDVISFTASNCSGANTDSFSDTIDVVTPPPPPDGDGQIHNGLSTDALIEDVLLTGIGTCTPYTGFPVSPGSDGTFTMQFEETATITVRFNGGTLPSSITMEIIINGSTVESDTHTPTSVVITSTNSYTIHAGDTIQINVF